MTPPHLTDAEVDDICAGLRQNFAKVRFLRDRLGLSHVDRKPNGRPLVMRAEWERRAGGAAAPAAQNGRPAGAPNWSKPAT